MTSGSGGQPPPPSPRSDRSSTAMRSRKRRPVGRLTDSELGWLFAAALFAWIRTRAEQATSEGWDTEETLRTIALTPAPWDAGSGRVHLAETRRARAASIGSDQSESGRRTR